MTWINRLLEDHHDSLYEFEKLQQWQTLEAIRNGGPDIVKSSR